jgi:3-phenylpropionate/trans-cinnamate dioxygenase ferredoxin reductase subunit
MEPHIIIVGAGQAGLQAGEALRAEGYAGTLTLVGEESYAPYHRPPLSKAWLDGSMAAEQLAIRSQSVLERKSITLRTNTSVVAIDTARRMVHLAQGDRLAYSGLVLATGARPRHLPFAAENSDVVRVLRSRDDANAVSDRLKLCAARGFPVVVIGGGFIGLEVTATARKLGLPATLVEVGPRLLSRVVAPPLSDWFAALHSAHGAELILGARVVNIQRENADTVNVVLADGRILAAGLVLVGIGVEPDDKLAREAGIECEGGIIVDACGRTSAPDVVAAGDCTVRRLGDGKLLRLESVQNAIEQGKSAAAALMGKNRPFDATPWFWSDQYDKKLQIAGLSHGADDWVVRGDMMRDATFSVYHFRAGRLVAVDSVNAAKEHMAARTVLAVPISITPKQVLAPDFDLFALARSALQPAGAAPTQTL